MYKTKNETMNNLVGTRRALSRKTIKGEAHLAPTNKNKIKHVGVGPCMNRKRIKTLNGLMWSSAPTEEYKIRFVGVDASFAYSCCNRQSLNSTSNIDPKKNSAITLIALVITIIVLLILAGITLAFVLGENGLISRAKNAKSRNNESAATEMMNLKITTCQIQSYGEKGNLPTLAYLAAFLQHDKEATGEIAYVEMSSQRQGSLNETPYAGWNKLYTKLSAYPDYEFEINSSLQLASINGVQVASNITDSQYESLLARIVALENNSNSQTSTSLSANYSTTESVVGTWMDGSSIYGKLLDLGTNFSIAKEDTVIASTYLPQNMNRALRGYFYITNTNSNEYGYDSCYLTYYDNKLRYGAMDQWPSSVDRHVYLYLEYTKNESN